MLRRIALTGLLIIYVTKGIFASELRHVKDVDDIPPPLDSNTIPQGSNVQTFIKSSVRTVRSTAASCQNSSTVIEVTYGDDAIIICSCDDPGSVKWFDAYCQELPTSTRMSVDDKVLKIKSYNKTDSSAYECKLYNGTNETPICESRTQIIAKKKVESGGNAAVGIVICVILAFAFVISLCCARKYKTTISLCLRDTCTSSSSERDGKEYDAYVSLGVSETDRKFVEGFVRDVLIKKYRYNLLVDDKNLLPRLEYSNKLQANLPKCRRLVIVFSASYMTHDWCMYCFNEGLRKIVDLHVPTIFVITDHSTQSELMTHIDIISHIPQIVLTQYQSSGERREAIERIRQKLPPPTKLKSRNNIKSGMRSPMLSDAESMDKSDVNSNNGAVRYTFVSPQEDVGDNVSMEYDLSHEASDKPDEYVTAVQHGDEIDPNKVKVNEYGARKDFYSLTMSTDEV